jgi:hypothetical protein
VRIKREGITINYISMNWSCASYVRDTCACYAQQSARKESSGERERGSRPCGATVRGCVPRASLRRDPKEVSDCLKFVVCLLSEGDAAVRRYRLAEASR